MMRYGKLGLLAILMGTPACVPLSQYKKLEQRCEEQEAYVVAHKDQVRELEKREQVMTLRAREQERQLELLRGRLEKSERLRQRAQEAPPMMASAPVIEQAPPTVVGLEVNPATNGLVMESGLLFAPGSAALKTEGKRVLDRVKDELNKPEYASHMVRIDGHTDNAPIQRSRGKNESNWDLASKRALAVLHYLEESGIASNRLSFSGFGPYRPIADGTDKTAMAKNRRVEIVLFDE